MGGRESHMNEIKLLNIDKILFQIANCFFLFQIFALTVSGVSVRRNYIDNDCSLQGKFEDS